MHPGLQLHFRQTHLCANGSCDLCDAYFTEPIGEAHCLHEAVFELSPIAADLLFGDLVERL